MSSSHEVEIAPGAKLRVVVEGRSDGRPLLFSNSLGSELAMWDAVVAALGPDLRIIRYDTRGHGGSDAPPGPYGIDALGQDAIAVLDAVGVRQAAFCGLSLGGATGMWLGANRPERFTHLVLANTAPVFQPRSMWEERAATVRAGGIASLVAPSMERWFTPAFRARRPDEVARGSAMIAATKPEGYAACCDALGSLDLRPDLPRIALPTLVVVGEADPSTSPAVGEEIRTAIPGASLVSLAAAHLSAIEAPDAFAAELERFLR